MLQGYSCLDLLNAGMRHSGVYYLQIRGTTYWFLKVFCEQEIAEGGWTVSSWNSFLLKSFISCLIANESRYTLRSRYWITLFTGIWHFISCKIPRYYFISFRLIYNIPYYIPPRQELFIILYCKLQALLASTCENQSGVVYTRPSKTSANQIRSLSSQIDSLIVHKLVSWKPNKTRNISVNATIETVEIVKEKL